MDMSTNGELASATVAGEVLVADLASHTAIGFGSCFSVAIALVSHEHILLDDDGRRIVSAKTHVPFSGVGQLPFSFFYGIDVEIEAHFVLLFDVIPEFGDTTLDG